MESTHNLIRFRRQDPTASEHHLDYTILTEADINQRQVHDISQVCSTLCLQRSAAITLLRHCNWNTSKLFDTWFDEENEVRNRVGLFKKKTYPLVRFSSDCSFTCEICFETYSGGDESDDHRVSSKFCGHFYCRACWVGYVSRSIDSDGLGCLSLKCPHPLCGASIGEDMIISLLAENRADKDKFSRYLLRSYVEESYRKRKIKWCPGPDCDCAVECVDDHGGYYDVFCACSYQFCWNCNEEAHSPVKCEIVATWMLKNKYESENTNWILVNTKPCPECKKPIEKNQGCNHMRCSAPCRFEFCWICLESWSRHHSCNSYESKQAGKNKEEKRKEITKKSFLNRFIHYYERWRANHESKQKAVQRFQLVKDVHLKKLYMRYQQTNPFLSFITGAWEEIIECRRLLKWSYAFGFYIPEQEQGKREFFEFLQGRAECGLEMLHHCAEVELQQQIDEEGSDEDFIRFRGRLVQLTAVIKNHFQNLMRAVKNDLSEISSHGDYWSYDVNDRSST